MYIHKKAVYALASHGYKNLHSRREGERAFFVHWFVKRGLKKSLYPVINYIKSGKKRLAHAMVYRSMRYEYHSVNYNIICDDLFDDFWIGDFIRDVETNEQMQKLCTDVTVIMNDFDIFYHCWEYNYLRFIKVFLIRFFSERAIDEQFQRYREQITLKKIEIFKTCDLAENPFNWWDKVPEHVAKEHWFIEKTQAYLCELGEQQINSLNRYRMLKIIESMNIPIPWKWYNLYRMQNFFELSYARHTSPYKDFVDTLYNNEYITLKQYVDAYKTGKITWNNEVQPSEECELLGI